jgi:hypothetical protein
VGAAVRRATGGAEGSMDVCTCGHPLRPGARFCPLCGDPVPVRRGAPWLPIAGMVALAAAAVAVLLVVRPWPVPSVPDPTPVPVPAAAPGPAPPPGSAAEQLREQVARDRPTVERLVGYWVPQVSSKAHGTLADGRTYTDADIITDHRAWVDRFSDAVLLRSADYSSFSNPNYWVTVVAEPFSTPSAANAWCTSANLGPDDCFAKLLSHTAGPAGTSAHR